MPQKTNAFWKVCRNASLCQRLMKLVRPIRWLGRPMKAFETEKYSAIQNGRETGSRGRSGAGPEKTGPPLSSGSRTSLMRAGRGGRRPSAISTVLMAFVGFPRHDFLHLVLGPDQRVLGRRAGDRLGDHV